MRIWSLATLLTLGLQASVAGQHGAASAHPQVRSSPSIGTLNGFVENRGQWTDEVLFVAGLNGIEATLLRDGLMLRPIRAERLRPDERTPDFVAQAPVRIRWPVATAVQGEGTLPTAHHFFLGSRSASFVPGFDRVVYHGVEPGIDIIVRRAGASFAYDVHVAAGVDLESLALTFEGLECAEFINGTTVEMHTAAGPVRQQIEACWQADPVTGQVRSATAKFRMLDVSGNLLRLGFEAPDRDLSAGLVIDPSLVYGTYVGGAAVEHVEDMLVMPDGAVYLAVHSGLGGASPTTAGTFQPLAPVGSNAWVGKLSPDGSSLEWATFLGGADKDLPTSVDVDTDATVVLGGKTHSIDFPVTPGCLQAAKSGNSDLFAARLSPDGSQLIWGTYYGGTDGDSERTSALSPSGNVLLAFEPGSLFGDPPPATPGAFDTVFDTFEQMLVCISADGTQLVFATYFSSDRFLDITFDEQSNIVFAGYAKANGATVPTTPGVLKEAFGAGADPADAFIAKLDPTGSMLHWATLFGGDDGAEGITGIALDASGAIYVSGDSSSADFPVSSGCFDPLLGPPNIAGIVAKLLPDATGFVWATYISSGFGGVSYQSDLVVDSAGNVISVGSSNKQGYPTTPDAFQPTYNDGPGDGDAHITKFDAFGEALIYSTYFGGEWSESSVKVSLDAAEDPHMVLQAGSSNLPTTPGAYDSSKDANFDSFVAKFDFTVLPWKVLGGALKGAQHTPNLAGGGALTLGSPVRLSLRGATPSSPAWLLLGLSTANLPFKGGTLVPTPTLIVPVATNGQGAMDLNFTWVNVPAGVQLYVQTWIKDVGAATGYSATNALRMTSQ